MQLVEDQTLEQYGSDYADFKGKNGNLLNLKFEAYFPIEQISQRKCNLWRYREALPINNDSHIISFEEGFTPLLPLSFGNKQAWIKQEQLFSSGSYKDRGATVLISQVKSLGINHVVQDSSGNAGCAIAAYAAKAKIACDIFVPADTSLAKLKQIEAYGAKINLVKGNREDTAEAALQAAQHTYYASHCYNPFFLHGTKTFAYEVCEQLGWKTPDAVVLPAGNGTLLLGCEIGFNDLFKAGIIQKIPKLIAVQSENCAPLANAFSKNLSDMETVNTLPTIAEGIAITKPVRGKQMLAAVRNSNGFFITVNEQEIINALSYCTRQGYYIEPTSAATIAGLEKYLQKVNTDEIVVSLFSGHGLKK